VRKVGITDDRMPPVMAGRCFKVGAEQRRGMSDVHVEDHRRRVLIPQEPKDLKRICGRQHWTESVV
jgi:hypothetical protein